MRSIIEKNRLMLKYNNAIPNDTNVKVLLCISFFILLTALIPVISALGVSPGRTTIDFEPSLQKSVEFTVFNSEHKDMQLLFYAKGNLSNYITLQQSSASFLPTDDSKTFSYIIKLPEKVETPGRYGADIVILEAPELGVKQRDTYIAASLAVVTQAVIYFPYPGKYLEFDIESIPSGSKTLLIFPIRNRGKLDIGNAKANIDIFTSSGKKAATIESDAKAVKSEQTEELFAELSDLSPGEYKAVVIVVYDGESIQKEKVFVVGSDVIEIESIEVNDFTLGGIAKFNILAKSNWNAELKDVTVQLLVYNEQDEIMADVKSPQYTIPTGSKTNVVAYWDTIGVKEAEYKGKLIIHYGGKESEKSVKVGVSRNNIFISGLTGFVAFNRNEKSIFNTKNLLIGAVVLLVLINIGWFIILRRRKKKD